MSIGGEYANLSKDAEAITYIDDSSELYNEFQHMSNKMWNIMDECNVSDDVVITKKEGLVVQSKITYIKVFDTLLGRQSQNKNC